MIEEKDILAYLDGNTSSESKIRVEEWINENEDNRDEFEFTKMMWEESTSAASYVQFDVSEEWAQFESNLEVEVPVAKVIPLRKEGTWRTMLSIAASAAVLVTATWFLWPQSEYIDIVDAGEDMELQLEDGSTISIKEGASFKTKRSYKYETSRSVEIAGEVKFDIASDPEKPFIVNTEESAVEVLGTIFNIKAEGVEAEVANEEGLVKFFIIERPSESVTLKKGDVIKYDGSGFIDLNAPPPPLPPAPRIIPKVKEILTYLKTVSNGRVSLGSGVDENILSELDIDYEGKTVRQIIRLMEQKAIVVYLDKGCPNCVEIVEIIPKKR